MTIVTYRSPHATIQADSMRKLSTNATGRLIKGTGEVYINGVQKWTEYDAFLPNPIPPENLYYTNEVMFAQEKATFAVGELRTTAANMSTLLISGIATAFRKKEAQLSSRIEGTIVPNQDLLLFDPDTSTTNPADVEEVKNFESAQSFAINQIRSGRPLSQHLLKQSHEILLESVRGAEWNPGQYRTLQNMIGTRKDIGSARYVPPPVEPMNALMHNLFEFIDDNSEFATMIRTGIAHYQFEAIHPFEDGNGRIGRLLIMLMLIKTGALDEPLLYPSSYFEAHQDEYRDRLLRVSTHGEWCEWLVFFLNGITHSARIAQERYNNFKELISSAEEKVKGPQAPQKMFDLITLFANEFVLTANVAAEKLETNPQNIRKYFKRLYDADVISKLSDRKKNVHYYLKGVHAIIGD